MSAPYDGTFSVYQQRATDTAVYPGQGGRLGLSYAILGLNGESGEIAEKVKKTWRDDGADIGPEVARAIQLAYEKLVKLYGDSDELMNVMHTLQQDARAALNPPLSPERREQMIDELGDLLWYVAQTATELRVDLPEVAGRNLKKLADRKTRDALHGSGDNR